MTYGGGNFRNKDDESGTDDDNDNDDGDGGRGKKSSFRKGSRRGGGGGGKHQRNTGPPPLPTHTHSNNVLGAGNALRNGRSSAPAAQQQSSYGTIQQRRTAYFSSAFPCEGRGESKQDVPGITSSGGSGGTVGFKRKASTAGVSPNNGMSVGGWSEDTMLGALTKAPQQRPSSSNGT